MKTRMLLAVLAATGLASQSLAQTPQFPQTMQPNTVVGRLGIGPGPAQQIPFANLQAGIFGAPSANTFFAGPTTGAAAGPTFRAIVAADLNPLGSTRGSILEQGASGWVGVVPGTAGLPWVSNGAGADPGYQALLAPNVNFTQSGTGAVQRTLDAKLKSDVTVSASDFGCAADGVTDDAACITNAIAALPAGGGRVQFIPGKSYCIKSSILIGNGSASAQSTTSGIHLVSTGSTFNFSGAPQTQIVWCGTSTSSALFVVFGPIKGWGFENIVINCGGLAGTGLKLIAASYGDNKNLTFNACTNQQLLMTTLATAATGSPNTQFNEFRNTQFFLPSTASIGAVLDGDSVDPVTDTSFNYFYNTSIIFPSAGATSLTGLQIKNADTNFFFGLSLFANGTNAGTNMVLFDYTAAGSGGTYPSGNQIFGADIKGNSTFAGTQAANNGTPGGAAHANSIYGMSEVNGAVCPLLNNLACFSARQLVLAQNGNVAPTDITAAWTAFTPSPTCGSATITTNSARSKTVGKSTFEEFDFTITALGTCTNSLSFTLPNTAQSAGAISGQEIVNTGKGISCNVAAGSSTMGTCRKADATNFAANDRLIGTGVYENQ